MKVKILYGVIPAVMISSSISQVFAGDMPVDCSTAKDDISTLESEKKETSDKAVGGILAYSPIGLVANVATGGDKMEEGEKSEAEEHNKSIDENIAVIEKACSDELSSGGDME